MLKSFLIGVFLFFSLNVTAKADLNVIKRDVPNAELVGEGLFTFLNWKVYTAELHAPFGRWESNEPYALTLQYFQKLKGKDIAHKSIKEIRGQGFSNEQKLKLWLKALTEAFPNVKKGSRLTGVRTKKGYTLFYHNSRRIAVITDPEFSKWFFGIWLDQKTSRPSFRKKLLGFTKS